MTASTHSHRAVLGAAFLLMAITGGAALAATTPDSNRVQPLAASVQPTVRVFYLVPGDRPSNPAYRLAVQNAAANVQVWYQQQMGGLTFRLADPVVQTVSLPHPANYYATTANGDASLWFWNNVLHDALALTGGRFFDQQNLWIYYIDADTSCNQITGATSSVSVMPANDLRGLNGQPSVDPCGGPAQQSPVSRWVGGLASLAGYAFGLGTPPGCAQGLPSCDSNALTWLGYINYPNTHLTPDQISQLQQSPFFLPGICPGNAGAMCLNAVRFQVSATWKTADGKAGAGTPIGLTSDTGYLWFFGSNNVEVIVKILNGCGLGGHYWVFAGGLTDVETTITVTDTHTGAVKKYTNPQGKPFQPIQDTSAFATCP